jgi:hypothetical protein
MFSKLRGKCRTQCRHPGRFREAFKRCRAHQSKIVHEQRKNFSHLRGEGRLHPLEVRYHPLSCVAVPKRHSRPTQLHPWITRFRARRPPAGKVVAISLVNDESVVSKRSVAMERACRRLGSNVRLRRTVRHFLLHLLRALVQSLGVVSAAQIVQKPFDFTKSALASEVDTIRPAGMRRVFKSPGSFQVLLSQTPSSQASHGERYVMRSCALLQCHPERRCLVCWWKLAGAEGLLFGLQQPTQSQHLVDGQLATAHCPGNAACRRGVHADRDVVTFAERIPVALVLASFAVPRSHARYWQGDLRVRQAVAIR